MRIEIAFGIIDTLDNLDAWYPKVPAPVQVEPVLKLVQPSQASKLTANAS